MCRFLSQEVCENLTHFIALTARVSPLRLGEFQARISNFTDKFTHLSMCSERAIS